MHPERARIMIVACNRQEGSVPKYPRECVKRRNEQKGAPKRVQGLGWGSIPAVQGSGDVSRLMHPERARILIVACNKQQGGVPMYLRECVKRRNEQKGPPK
jgi:hypothetical protein